MLRHNLVRGILSLSMLSVLMVEFIVHEEHEYHVEHKPIHKIAVTALYSDDDHRHIPTVNHIGAL